VANIVAGQNRVTRSCSCSVCCSALHCDAVCCSALQGVAVCCSLEQEPRPESNDKVLQLQCVLQCVAGCCSVLQSGARASGKHSGRPESNDKVL